MAQTRKPSQAEHHLRLVAGLVPAGIDQAELRDRLAYSTELTRKAQSATDPVIRKGFVTLAKAMLNAPPRDEVARQHQALMDKVNALPPGPHADALRTAAQKLLDDNPPAPTPDPLNRSGTTGLGLPRNAPQAARPGDVPGRTVIKATDRLPVAVFDHRRRLAGIVDPARIVLKASGQETPLTPVFNEAGQLVGVCPADAITPVTKPKAQTSGDDDGTSADGVTKSAPKGPRRTATSFPGRR